LSIPNVAGGIPTLQKSEPHRFDRARLLTVWDPIGIRDESNAQDEYDGYLGGVFDLLTKVASDDQIREHLWQIVKDRMQLPAKKEDMRSTISALRQIQIPQEST
jgi:hypothetical protein